MPIFLHDNGRVLLPTARHVWEQLISDQIHLQNHIVGQDATLAFERVWKTAEIQGKAMYEELMQAHLRQLAQERERGERTFLARRQAVERIGLSSVRTHRSTQLMLEEQLWRERLESKARIVPDVNPLIIIRIDGKRVQN